MTQRLPIPGQDDGTWGDILNGFLEVSLNADGTIQTAALTQAGGVTSVNSISPTSGSVTLTPASLASGSPSSSTYLRGDGTWAVPNSGSSSLASDTDVTITSPSNNQVLTYNSGAGKWENLAPVISSVFGRTGAVVATSGDYSASQVTGAAPIASPTFTGKVTTPALQVTTGSGTANQVLTSDTSGNATWANPASAPVTSVDGMTGAVTGLLQSTNNLNDVTDAGSSRQSLHIPILTAAAAVAIANVSLSAPGATCDGYSFNAGDILLLTAQSTSSQNGPWVWTGASTALARPNEFATGATVKGRIINILNGSVYSGTIWSGPTAATAGIVVDTGSQSWTEIVSTTSLVNAALTGVPTVNGQALVIQPQAQVYGAFYNTRGALDGAITSGQSTLTSSVFHSSADNGKTVVIRGAGSGSPVAPLVATVVSATSGSATISTTAGTTVSSALVTLGNDDTAGTQAALNAAPTGGIVDPGPGFWRGLIRQRNDASCGTTNSSSTVTDSSIATTDAGKLVKGPGIPIPAFVGTVTAGTSFTLVNSSGTATTATATASVTLSIGGLYVPVGVKLFDSRKRALRLQDSINPVVTQVGPTLVVLEATNVNGLGYNSGNPLILLGQQAAFGEAIIFSASQIASYNAGATPIAFSPVIGMIGGYTTATMGTVSGCRIDTPSFCNIYWGIDIAGGGHRLETIYGGCLYRMVTIDHDGDFVTIDTLTSEPFWDFVDPSYWQGTATNGAMDQFALNNLTVYLSGNGTSVHINNIEVFMANTVIQMLDSPDAGQALRCGYVQVSQIDADTVAYVAIANATWPDGLFIGKLWAASNILGVGQAGQSVVQTGTGGTRSPLVVINSWNLVPYGTNGGHYGWATGVISAQAGTVIVPPTSPGSGMGTGTPNGVAALVLDSVSPSEVITSASSLTWSHICGAGAGLLVVGLLTASNNVSSVTYNSISMTQSTSSPIAIPTTTQTLSLWYLLGPPQGTYNVVVTTSASDSFIYGGSISYIDTARRNPTVDTATSATSTSAGNFTQSITPSGNNDWAIVLYRNGSSESTGVGTMNALRLNIGSGVLLLGDSNGWPSTQNSPISFTGSASAGNDQAIIIASFTP